jgi:hypothetical protein
MARKRGLLEIIAVFLAAVIVLTGCKASAAFFYGPPISTIFNALFYLAILGFIVSVLYGVYLIVTKAGRNG